MDNQVFALNDLHSLHVVSNNQTPNPAPQKVVDLENYQKRENPRLTELKSRIYEERQEMEEAILEKFHQDNENKAMALQIIEAFKRECSKLVKESENQSLQEILTQIYDFLVEKIGFMNSNNLSKTHEVIQPLFNYYYFLLKKVNENLQLVDKETLLEILSS